MCKFEEIILKNGKFICKSDENHQYLLSHTFWATSIVFSKNAKIFPRTSFVIADRMTLQISILEAGGISGYIEEKIFSF